MHSGQSDQRVAHAQQRRRAGGGGAEVDEILLRRDCDLLHRLCLAKHQVAHQRLRPIRAEEPPSSGLARGQERALHRGARAPRPSRERGRAAGSQEAAPSVLTHR